MRNGTYLKKVVKARNHAIKIPCEVLQISQKPVSYIIDSFWGRKYICTFMRGFSKLKMLNFAKKINVYCISVSLKNHISLQSFNLLTDVT